MTTLLGSIPYHLISASGTNGTIVYGKKANLVNLIAGNVNASPRFIHFYDTASAPTVGTTPVIWTAIVPGNTAGAGGAVTVPLGLQFLNGLAFSITGGMADSDTSAIGAGDVCLSLAYLPY